MSGEKLNGAWLGHTAGLLPGGSFRMGHVMFGLYVRLDLSRKAMTKSVMTLT